MNEPEQVVEVVGYIYAPDDFKVHLPLEFGAFVICDVLYRALITNDLAVRVSHRARVFGNPDFRAIFASKLIFKLFNHTLLFDPPFEFLAKFRIGIGVLGHVGYAFQHFPTTGISAHSRKRGIHA